MQDAHKNFLRLKGAALGQVITDTGAFLKDLELFDPVEFGITSKDARLMNLGTRKLIETTFLALLDSGIDYRGRNVGCYMSAVAHDIFSVSGHVSVSMRCAILIVNTHRLTPRLVALFPMGRRWSRTACHTISTYVVLACQWIQRVALPSTLHISL